MNNIKKIREEKNISIAMLSDLTKIKRDKLSKMERGINTISIRDAIELSKVFGVNVLSNAKRERKKCEK